MRPLRSQRTSKLSSATTGPHSTFHPNSSSAKKFSRKADHHPCKHDRATQPTAKQHAVAPTNVEQISTKPMHASRCTAHAQVTLRVRPRWLKHTGAVTRSVPEARRPCCTSAPFAQSCVWQRMFASPSPPSAAVEDYRAIAAGEAAAACLGSAIGASY